MANVGARAYAGSVGAELDEALARMFPREAGPEPAVPAERVRIMCISLADGRTEGVPVGCYLAAYDPEAEGGEGSASWTADPAEAMAFGSAIEAMICYRAQPKARPLRPDGMPNRPLTVFSIVLD